MWSWISPFSSNTTDTNNNGDENTNTNDFDFETELLEAELSSEENDWEIIGDSDEDSSNMPVNAQNKATEIQQNEPLLPLLIEKDLSIFTCNETNVICKDWAILSTPEEQEREEQLMQQLQMEQQVHFEQQQYLEEQLENVLSFEEELRQKELNRQEEQLRQQQKAKQQNQLLQQQLKEQQQLVLESQLELEKQQATQKAFLEKLQLEEQIRKEEQLMFEEQLKRDQEQHRLLEQQKTISQPKNDNQSPQQMDFIAISRPSQALQFLATTTDLGYSEQPIPIAKKKQKKNLNSRKRKRKKGKSKQLAAATLSSKSNRTALNRAAKRHIVQKRASNVDSKSPLTISRRINHTNAHTTSNQLLLNNAFVDEKVLATRHKETTHQLKVYVNSQTITKPSKKSSRMFNNSSKNNNRNKVLFKKQSHRSSYCNTRNL